MVWYIGDMKTVTIEGETWHATLTPDEFAEWERYANTHEWLLNWSYAATLTMFLFNFRRLRNPNLPLCK